MELLWEGMVEAESATFLEKRAGLSDGRVGSDHAKAIPKAARKHGLADRHGSKTACARDCRARLPDLVTRPGRGRCPLAEVDSPVYDILVQPDRDGDLAALVRGLSAPGPEPGKDGRAD